MDWFLVAEHNFISYVVSYFSLKISEPLEKGDGENRKESLLLKTSNIPGEAI
jgi:hypothetical protein